MVESLLNMQKNRAWVSRPVQEVGAGKGRRCYQTYKDVNGSQYILQPMRHMKQSDSGTKGQRICNNWTKMVSLMSSSFGNL